MGSVSFVVFIGGGGVCNILLFCEVCCDYGGVYCCEVDVGSCSVMVSGLLLMFVVYCC